MNFKSAFIMELTKVVVRMHGVIISEQTRHFWITENERVCAISGISPHEDSMGLDIYLAEDIDLAAFVKVRFDDGASIPAEISYMLYDTPAFETKYFYGGALGAVYTKKSTEFKLWAPTASEVVLNLGSNGGRELPMQRSVKGIFEVEVEENLAGTEYFYTVTILGEKRRCIDPYAKAFTTNAAAGVVADLAGTNPSGFEYGAHVLPKTPTDAVLYEMHVRDFTIAQSSGVKAAGKFLGLAESGRKTRQGDSAGLDHLKELGVTHVHLLPIMDFATVDESYFSHDQYNWGYDPHSYFVPDGSYSTDPASWRARISELKQMVTTLHKNGIGVVLDVVYNHTYATRDSLLNMVVTDYYYRKGKNKFTNGSGCGNELASERCMVRKLMTDSLTYWAQEYNIDGFRFDLMGVHDIQTMNYLRHKLDEIDSRLIMYGEGWQGGASALPIDKAALKSNAGKVSDRIAFFNDDMRDAIKGNCFDGAKRGYLGGSADCKVYSGFSEQIKSGIAGAVWHPHIMYTDGKAPFAKRPTQTVTYDSAHDNYTLFDKLRLANPQLDEADIIKLNKLAAVLVLCSQGIPFLHSGEELLRTKTLSDGSFEHNSYNCPDSVNQIDWSRKHTYRNVFDYYKGLIAFRKEHKALRCTTAEDISDRLRFLYTEPENRLCFTLNGEALGDISERITIVINPTSEAFDCRVYDEEETAQEEALGWNVYADGDRASSKPLYAIKGDTVKVQPFSAMILARNQL